MEKNQTHIPPHVHNWLLCTTCVEPPLDRVPALAHEAAAGRDAVEVTIPRKGSEALDEEEGEIDDGDDYFSCADITIN